MTQSSQPMLNSRRNRDEHGKTYARYQRSKVYRARERAQFRRSLVAVAA